MNTLTTDRNDPGLQEHQPDGQQEKYLILSDEERGKGFVQPVRRKYQHIACGGVTTMGLALAETYARDPKFYTGTFCCNCSTHFPLSIDGVPQFKWDDSSGAFVGE